MDKNKLRFELAIMFADREAKKRLISQCSKEHKEDIENTPWTKLCEGVFPTIKVDKDAKKYHEEMYTILSDFLASAFQSIFPKKNIEDLEKLDKKLFSEIPEPFCHNDEWRKKYESKQKMILLFYLEALSDANTLLADYLRKEMQELSICNPVNL